MGFTKWKTLLTLKEDMDPFRKKGTKFFISEFVVDLDSGDYDLKFVITSPSFTDFGLSTGMVSFVVSKDYIKENFNVSSQTFEEYEKEYMTKHLKERSDEYN